MNGLQKRMAKGIEKMNSEPVKAKRILPALLAFRRIEGCACPLTSKPGC